jgi:hypothetical protein
MIPPHAHLVWLGPRLNALAYLAARSALARGGFTTITLHHDEPLLADDPLVRDLAARPGFVLSGLDVAALAHTDRPGPEGLGEDVWQRLGHLDRTLALPASRSNLHRLQLLWLHGGVYLDTDLLVLRDFRPLLGTPGFGGVERICFPIEVVGGRNPLRWAHAGALTALRAAVCRFAPSPGGAFRRVEGLFFLAVNNAVLGAEPGHPLVRRVLHAAAALSDDDAYRRFRLGPRLLQEVTRNRSTADFVLHAPPAFYPLPPEVCRAYVQDDPDARLGHVPDERTFAAHLYDSNLRAHLGAPVDAAYLRRTRGRTLLARMAEPYLDDLFDALRSEAA